MWHKGSALERLRAVALRMKRHAQSAAWRANFRNGRADAPCASLCQRQPGSAPAQTVRANEESSICGECTNMTPCLKRRGRENEHGHKCTKSACEAIFCTQTHRSWTYTCNNLPAPHVYLAASSTCHDPLRLDAIPKIQTIQCGSEGGCTGYTQRVGLQILESATQAASTNTAEATQRLWGGLAHITPHLLLRVTRGNRLEEDAGSMRDENKKRSL